VAVPEDLRRRRLAARAVAAASAFFWGFLFFGIIDLSVPVDETAGFEESYLLETGWGVLYTVLVGAAFAWLVARPELVMPVVQLALVSVCLTVTAVVAGSWVQLVPAALLASNCYVVAALAHGRPRWPDGWRRPSLDPVVGVLAVVLVPPAVLFAADMVMGYRDGRPPLDDDTWGIDHWPTQAALALAAAAVALAVSAGVRARWSGTAVSAGCVAVAAGWFGYLSATYPEHAGSAGRAWGVSLVVWAVLFGGAVGWRLTTSRARTGTAVP
jgi:hypothetical protein